MQGSRLLPGIAAAVTTLAAAPALAQVGPQASPPATSSSNAQSSTGSVAPSNSKAVEQIVVTANKRRELARRVANSVTAISGAELARRQEVNLQSLASQIPGFSLETDDKTAVRVVLRGLNTGSSGTTVASVLDDVPTNGTGAQNNASINTPNFDTYDLQRIEVLRGPQGTLYGATAEGGIVKYVTNVPDLNTYSGSLEGGIQGTTVGGIGGTLKGFANLPLGNGHAAVRISAWNEWTPGYIDNPELNKSNSNSAQQYGFRASVLVQPVPELNIRLTAERQSLFSNNADYVEAVGAASTPLKPPANQLSLFDGLVNNTAVSGTSQSETAVYYANVNYDFGWANLTSITSYSFDNFALNADEGNAALAAGVNVGQLLASQVYGEPIVADLKQNSNTGKFNQEVRLTSDTGLDIFGRSLDYLGGGYFTHETTSLLQNVVGHPAASPSSSLVPPLGGDGISGSLSEWALFGQVDYHILDRVDVALGGRLSGNDQHSVTSFATGVLTGTAMHSGVISSNDHDQLYSVAPRWRPTDDTTLYGRIATGYRPGGPNQPVPGVTGLPASYQSDRVVNYEVGWRQDFLGKRVSVDLTGFYVNWKRVQILSIINTPAGPFSIEGNAGSAVSKGVEWSFQWVPLSGLTLSAVGSYTDARIAADAPGLGATNGEYLPYVPDVTNSVNVEYSWKTFADYDAYVSGTWSFTGDRYTGFTPSQTVTVSHALLPSYSTGAIRAGLESRRYSFEAFINNISDERGITYYASNGGSNETGQVSLIMPRTIGALVRVKF